MTRTGICQRLLLATILAAGFAVVWGLVSLWATQVGTYVVATDTGVKSLIYLADGTPRVISIDGRRGGREYFDLEGHPVEVPDGDEHARWSSPIPLPAALPDGQASGDLTLDKRLRSFADGRAPAGYWYFVSDGRTEGTGYFVGYDSQSHGCIGYLGIAGFRAEPLPGDELIPFAGRASGPGARVFCTQREYNPTEHPAHRSAGRAPRGSVSTWDVYVLGRDERIYHADLQNRTLQVFEEGRCRSAALVTGPPDPVRGTPFRLAARTEDTVRVLDERGQPLQSYTIPEALRGRGFAFAETSGGEDLMCWNSPRDSLATEVEYRVFQVSPDGRYREAAVTLPNDGTMRSMRILGGSIVPAPLVLGGLVGLGRSSELMNEGLEANYSDAVGRALTEFWPALALAQLVACGLAFLCYRRQVRYGARGLERIVWPLFVLALGLPAWAGYRFGRSWPMLESCPACDVRVPRDREDCIRCATDFPRPALKGTEVFA